jgi:hypothetical protein
MTAPLAAPPYALAIPEFPCPGLASLAASAPVGGPRESALACIMLIRLATAVVAPVELSQELRRERAEAARAWLSTLPLESSLRTLITRALNATATATPAEIAAELDLVAGKLADTLDRASTADLAHAARRLRRQTADLY